MRTGRTGQIAISFLIVLADGLELGVDNLRRLERAPPKPPGQATGDQDEENKFFHGVLPGREGYRYGGRSNVFFKGRKRRRLCQDGDSVRRLVLFSRCSVKAL